MFIRNQKSIKPYTAASSPKIHRSKYHYDAGEKNILRDGHVNTRNNISNNNNNNWGKCGRLPQHI